MKSISQIVGEGRQRLFEALPYWLFSKRLITTFLILTGFLVLGLFLLSLVFAEQTVLDQARVQVQTQRMLEPVVTHLRRESASIASKLHFADEGVTYTVSGLLDRLRAVAYRAELRNAEFIPDPTSAGDGDQLIRVTTFCEGSTDAVRHFMVLLSELSWLERIDAPIVRTSGEWREFAATLYVRSRTLAVGKEKPTAHPVGGTVGASAGGSAR